MRALVWAMVLATSGAFAQTREPLCAMTRARRLAGLLGEVEGQKKLEATKASPDKAMLRRRLVDFRPDRPREVRRRQAARARRR